MYTLYSNSAKYVESLRYFFFFFLRIKGFLSVSRMWTHLPASFQLDTHYNLSIQSSWDSFNCKIFSHLVTSHSTDEMYDCIYTAELHKGAVEPVRYLYFCPPSTEMYIGLPHSTDMSGRREDLIFLCCSSHSWVLSPSLWLHRK